MRATRARLKINGPGRGCDVPVPAQRPLGGAREGEGGRAAGEATTAGGRSRPTKNQEIRKHRLKSARNELTNPQIPPDRRALTTLLDGVEPFAVQTMLYFKPPGARGQAVHQDQYYLRVDPGTRIAAWQALDRCDEENGCLEVDAACSGPAATR
jgi:ectoine hydroxylase-related dioxygenase (phytanoyl-CoA dioxygenase family)